MTSRDHLQPYRSELHSDQTMETDSAVMIKHITRFIWSAVKEKLNRKATAQLVQYLNYYVKFYVIGVM